MAIPPSFLSCSRSATFAADRTRDIRAASSLVGGPAPDSRAGPPNSSTPRYPTEDVSLPLDEESRLCATCAGGDAFLAARIARDGERSECSNCGHDGMTFSVAKLGDLVHELFKRFAVLLGDQSEYPWRTDVGKSPLDTLQDELGVPLDVAEALLDYLAESYPRDQHHDPGYDWYAGDSEVYALRPTPSSTPADEWDVFVERIRYHGRFFNDEARQYLDDLFGPLLRGELHHGAPPLVTLGGDGSAIKRIFRGRAANTQAEQAAIYANPRCELAPPPAKLRRPNRMNAEGVRAFYGALDIETCVAELRPAVHGYVIVGTFELVQPVRVLDLRLIDNAVPQVSWFDPEFSEKVAAGEFVRELHDTMRVAVFPGDEFRNYLPTQVIAEYLASKGVEGVLYVSSLVDREKPDEEGGLIHLRPVDDEGVNVVLFSRSAIVVGDLGEAEYDVVRVDVPMSMDLGVPLNRQYVERKKREPAEDLAVDYPLVDDAVEPTLELLVDEITISQVRGIKHTLVNHEISYISRDEPEKGDEDLPF